MSVEGRIVVTFFFSLIILGLLIVSSILPWYSITFPIPESGSFELKLGLLFGYDGSLNDNGKKSSVFSGKWQNTSDFPNEKNVYELCGIFTLLSFITYCFLLICSLFLCLKSFRKMCYYKRSCSILHLLSFCGSLFILISTLLLLRQPDGLNKDFTNYFPFSCGQSCHSFSGSNTFETWGPTYGWYIIWSAFFLSIVLFLILSCCIKRKHGYHLIN